MDTLTFIDKYEGAAIKDAISSGVPASITMAQAILESGHGNSPLFIKSNNSFGIKCAGGWTGAHVYANDDAPNECFRAYPSVLDSFKDHSSFLKQNSRYDFLFNYPQDDYQSWAYGLKKAGYATAPNYAQALISTIQNFNLASLDTKVKLRKVFRIFLLVISPLVIITIAFLVYLRYKKSNLKIAS